MDNFYKDFFATNVKDKKLLKKQELYNLYQRPKKETKAESAHYNFAYSPNVNHQADLLYLPDDEGYKYCLVVTDIATRKSDAEPMKEKSSIATKKALQKIYSRGILQMPETLTMDSGKEFHGDVIKYCQDNTIAYKHAKVGRHKQLSVVESTNKYLAKGLFYRMTAQEINTGETSREWIEVLPEMIKYINKKRITEPPQKPSRTKKNAPICSGNDCNLLELGTKVRVVLDNPLDYATDKKLHGRFRVTDIRWDPVIRTVTNYMLFPNQPPLYMLDDENRENGVDTKAAYTLKQLQVVPDGEQAPPPSVIKGKPTQYVVEKILAKKKEKNRVYLLVKWKGWPDEKDQTWELRSELIKTAAKAVNDFEKSN